MSFDYNVVQYVIPEKTEILFSILPHTRDAFLELKNGTADFHMEKKQVSLVASQYFPMPIWECLSPLLKAKTPCDIHVQGCHYVFFAVQKEPTEKALFTVFPSDKTFSFVLEKHIQLQIFPFADSVTSIKISRGAPEISGYRLAPKVTYALSMYSPVLIQSSDDQPYSVYVQGLNRKVRLSILDENHQKFVKAVREHIFTQSLFANKLKRTIPTILVLGPKNVGKSSFCQLLVNDALEKSITPVYIDLNIRRGLSMPGSLSLTEIGGRIASTLDFNYNIQRLLHFGALLFHPINIRIYCHLIRKMGALLTFHPRRNVERKYLAVIDTSGYLSDNNHILKCILKSFSIDLAVVIGDRHYYDNLKQSTLEAVPSEFIPKPRDVEPQDKHYEAAYWQYRIKRYFLGPIERPLAKTVRKINLERIRIFNISAPSDDLNVCDEKVGDFKLEPVVCSSRILNHMLGVSHYEKVNLFTITEIKYYVCLTAVDVSSKTASFLVPEPENFNGGILLMGYVLKLWN